ncbi:tRNA (cytosine(72)-C(5))-methyltransferase NSUN6-like isoform X2 [Mytilus edulis]|uniref:tRNA (cytosine(72)-C(5))-methyltransferase NSUN6-like isoform X2 n=1 Tax=Mytilus edulis TaxID=6550 RepID=UPI0039EE4F5E
MIILHVHEHISAEGDRGDDRFEHLLFRLGCPPLFTTLRINTLIHDTNTVIASLRKEIEKNYRLRGLDMPDICLHPVLHDTIVIKNKGPVCREKVKKEVIVDLLCGMAVLRGADVFVQGILGCPSGTRAGDKVSVYADVDGKCLRGLTKTYDGQKLFVGNGIVQFSREEIYCNEQPLSGIGVLMAEPLYEAPSLSGTCVDMIFPQNLPSIVCSHILDPQPGETILDMCAAPGGKTTHLAVLMKNKGILVAIDKTVQKIEKIQTHAKEWDIHMIETYPYDSTKMVDNNADSLSGPPFPNETFDKVLLDGPCSALGQRPSKRNKMSLNSLKSYSTYQRKLLKAAVQLLKPGGTLVYSTCTFNQEENEKQVVWALKTFSELSLEPQVPHLGQIGQVCEGLTDDQRQKLQFYDPGAISSQLSVDNDTIGFFIAKFKKNK